MRLVLHPLCEPPHSGMVSKRLHGIIASCEVCVAEGDVYVSVTWAAQGDRRARVTSLELFLPFLLRFIFLERERGKRWWRVRRSSPRSLPHSWHLPAVLCPEFSSLGAIPRLYGPSTRTPRHLLSAAEGSDDGPLSVIISNPVEVSCGGAKRTATRGSRDQERLEVLSVASFGRAPTVGA